MTSPRITHLTNALSRQISETAGAWSRCFDSKDEFSLKEPMPYSAWPAPPGGAQPGLLVHVQVERDYLLLVIPAALLPSWFDSPNPTQSSRLETLAMEWALTCVPEDWVTDGSATHVVDQLSQAIPAWQPRPDAVCAEISVGSAGSVWAIWPMRGDPDSVTVVPEGDEVEAEQDSGPPVPPHMRPIHEPRLIRLANLPVRLIVQLAHKRIRVGQLLSLGPGALITFEKPCEAPLDLYLNNALFARGEAVKVGEKFGLKIQEIGPSGPQIATT